MNRSFETRPAAGRPAALWLDRPCPARPPAAPDASVAWSFSLAPTPEAPGHARRAIAPLAAHLRAEVMDTARLLVSELVTNSVLHSGDRRSAIGLRARLLPELVVICVADQGAGFDPEELRHRRSHDLGGRGLELVATLADERGIASRRPFRLWFALSR